MGDILFGSSKKLLKFPLVGEFSPLSFIIILEEATSAIARFQQLTATTPTSSSATIKVRNFKNSDQRFWLTETEKRSPGFIVIHTDLKGKFWCPKKYVLFFYTRACCPTPPSVENI